MPAEDFRACGYRPDDLRAGVADERFGRLMSLQITRAESLYREAAELLDWLEPPGPMALRLDDGHLQDRAADDCQPAGRGLRAAYPVGGAKRLTLARWSLLPPRKASLQ